jgi:hypothetical protein
MIIYSSPFAQKLWIGGYVEVQVGIGPSHDPTDLAIGTDRHCRFRNDYHVVFGNCRDFFSGGINIAKVSVTVAPARWCSYCDKHGIGRFESRGQIMRELKSACRDVFCKKRIKPRFVDWNLARIQPIDF